MGWAARLPKDKKEKFEKTCNKCGGTGIKRTYISIAGVTATEMVKCKCVIPKIKVVKNAGVVE